MLFTALPPLQAAGKDYQNADVLATVRQHDRGVGFWQPGVRERSKYGRHDERERRGLTEHQRAVLIHPASHLAVILSCQLTVHQQRAPYGFIFHRLSVRHCGCSWKRYRGEKDILSCHRDFRHCHCQVWHHLPSWAWRSSASCFVTDVIGYCVHVCVWRFSVIQFIILLQEKVKATGLVLVFKILKPVALT